MLILDIQSFDVWTFDFQTFDIQTFDIQTFDIQTFEIQIIDIQTFDINKLSFWPLKRDVSSKDNPTNQGEQNIIPHRWDPAEWPAKVMDLKM